MGKGMKYIKSYNESVKDFLKPKSEDEIMNKFGSLEQIFIKSIQYNQKDYIEKYKNENFLIKIDYELYKDLFNRTFDGLFSNTQKDEIYQLLLKNNNMLKYKYNKTENKYLNCSLQINYAKNVKIVIDYCVNNSDNNIKYYMICYTNGDLIRHGYENDNYFICNNYNSLIDYIKSINIKPLSIIFSE